MNREIKFRAKSVESGEWVIGYYYYGHLSQQHFLISEAQIGNPYFNRIMPETLGQFTGALDKDGTEIYQGDIAKSLWQHDGVNNYNYEMKGQIVFDVYHMQFELFVDKGDSAVSFPLYSFEREELIKDTLEVIGDIYTTPELLNK